jgi:hypothetical protein
MHVALLSNKVVSFNSLRSRNPECQKFLMELLDVAKEVLGINLPDVYPPLLPVVKTPGSQLLAECEETYMISDGIVQFQPSSISH